MKLLSTLLADLRERQILPAVVLLTLLAIAIPVGATIALSKVTVSPPPTTTTPHVLTPAKGLPSTGAELSVLNATPVKSITRHGTELNPLQVAGATSASGTTSAAGSTTTPAKTTPATTTPAHTTTTPAHTTTPTHTTTTHKTTPTHKTTTHKTTTHKTTTHKTTPTHTTTTPAHTTTTPVQTHTTTTPAQTHTTTTPAQTHTTTTATQTHTTTTATHTSSSQTHSSTTTSHTTTSPATTHPKPQPPALATPSVGPAVLKSTQAYATTLDTSDAKGKHVLADVVRLAPLPAAESPEVIFLGVLRGGKKAVFLFTNTVQVSGSSRVGKACLPSPSDCQIVELSPGQGMKLAPISNSSLIATFTFEVGSIGASNFQSATAAKAARDATSSAGTTLLPLSAAPELGNFHFDDSVGALIHQILATGSTSTTGASGSSGVSGATGTTGASPVAGATGATAVPGYALEPLRR